MGSLWQCNFYLRSSNKVLNHLRHLSKSCARQAVNKNLSLQGKAFNKLLDGSKKKRKFLFDNSEIPSSGAKLSIGKHIKNSKENSRRIGVLNALFMKHISDLLVTGNIGGDLLSKGLEISRISMNSHFNQLNIFWGTHSEENVAELESILPDIGYTLRHELSQLRVMGVVPRISFVKDKHFTNGPKVDYLLQRADFGEDHVPSELGSDFKNESIPCQDNNQSLALTDEQETCETSTFEDEEAMPAMRHDVFNLDHQLIMKKILKKMQKSRAIHRFEPNLAINSDGNIISSSDISPTDKLTKEERKEALAKFVLSRKILQEKMLKNKYNTDKEIHLQYNDDDDEDEHLEVEDYIEEDFEEKKLQS